jgi:flavin reductase (DIM6/NTAB) family NADH-FMN oxidoreductase RutF
MSGKLLPINVFNITDNTFKLIAKDWMLVTAGKLESFNTMTASWGTFGELWHKKICVCFVRPVRHTYQFMEESDTFTLTFFGEEHRDALKFCGSHSGRDVNKMAQTGLTPAATETGSVYFKEARLVIECRKIYIHDLDPANFLDPAIDKEYPDKDYHRMYIGEVIQVLRK